MLVDIEKKLLKYNSTIKLDLISDACGNMILEYSKV